MLKCLRPKLPSEREKQSLLPDIEKKLSCRIGANPDLVLRTCQPYVRLSRIDTRYVFLGRCFMMIVPELVGWISDVAFLLQELCKVQMNYVSYTDC